MVYNTVLGIESTCDETSAALVQSGRCIISHVIASQSVTHSQFGGVVPELASRCHVDAISSVITSCLDQAAFPLSSIDLIAVAKGPGLIGSLLVGIQTAKALSWSLDKPLVGVNHIEAHLYAAIMGCDDPSQYFPALGVVLSGGHTTLVEIEGIGQYRLIGQTVDDALGEAFDKVAKLLGLGYPGGPTVERRAALGDPNAFPFRSGIVKGKPLCFSFSGLKTAVLYAYQALLRNGPLSEQTVSDLCASFQKAAFQDVTEKIASCCATLAPKAIFLGGGVSQNQALRRSLSQRLSIPLFWPSLELCQDNAAMIAGLGFHVWHINHLDERHTLDAITRVGW